MIKNNAALQHKLVIFIIVAMMVPFFFLTKGVIASFKQSQDKKEKIITKTSLGKEPIEILELRANEKVVKLSEEFVQDDNWLKDFTVRFKNVSKRTITHVELLIDFPETLSTGNLMLFPLRYGVNSSVRREIQTEEPVLLKRSEIAEIKLSEKRFAQLKQFIETRQLFSELKRANLRIMLVQFEDRTNWSGGGMYRSDPNNPKISIPLNEEP